MNKDVIYIEPEDDITDIITKIENSKEKIVALVPPKKAGVFRSIVNIKLITKAGVNAEKVVVLVTTDPSIVKLAAVTKLPITKNLRSAPIVPKVDEVEKIEATMAETIVDEVDEKEAEAETEEVEALEDEAKPEEKKADKEEQIDDEEVEETKGGKEDKDDEKDKKKDDESDKEAEKKEDNKKEKADKAKKAKSTSSNPFIAWVQNHKILLICSGIGLIILILVLIWANAIAPAVTIDVVIRTTTANFSENVTFTNQLAEEDISKGLFYLEEKKVETKVEETFEATGKKNVGEKASGNIVVYTYFRNEGALAIDKGTIFANDGKSYISTEAGTLSWDGKDPKSCDNNGSATIVTSGCLVSARVPVVAENSGSAYNLAASNTGWSTVANIGVYTDSAISGGTDETITVVQQSDIDATLKKIEEKLSAEAETNKEKLFEELDESDFIIESSFKQTVGDAVSVPAVGEPVKEGEKPKLSVTTTSTIYVIDDVKVGEFIKEKAKLTEGYKIYEMNDPFIENFAKTDAGYVGKLKTSYVSGPEVTAKDVVETVKGKGLGTGRDDLTKAYSGISKVTTEVSFPWVTAFPNDEEKITVNITVGESN